MEYLTHSLIDESEALQIVNKLKAEKSSWQDGKKTAGSHAAEIKSNFQGFFFICGGPDDCMLTR